MKTQKKRLHFNGREWFQKNVDSRTDAALQKKNKEFAAEHAADSKKELIDYLKACAEKLEHTPNRNEVIGGRYIARRFDGWENAILEAGLPLSLKRVDRKKTRLYQDEYKVQAELIMNELQERKNQKIAEQQKRQEQQQEAKEELLTEEHIWAKEHQNDTDENLIDYVCQCAEKLGHTPYRREVLGSKCIAERFGGWYETLVLAKLPIPKDMKPPSDRKKRQLKRRK